MSLASKFSWCYTHVMWYRSIARKPCDACEEEQISKLSSLKSTSSVDKMVKWILYNQICAAVTAILKDFTRMCHQWKKKNDKETHACIVEPSRSNDCHHSKGEVTPLRPLPPHTWGHWLSSKTPNSSNGRGSKGQSFTNEKIISNTFVVLIWLLRPWKGSP